MPQDPSRAGLPDSVEYQPLPNIYRAFAAGASPYAIITETIDNSIDFVRRQALNGAKYPDKLRVSVKYELDTSQKEEEKLADDLPVEERGSGRLVITDNAGGVPPNELARFFQLGHTDAPPEGIGRFGVGAKRLIGIGDRIKYESHANGYQVGAGFEVDARELEGERASPQYNQEDTYQSDVYPVEDLEEGSTRIVVEELNSNVWSNLLGRREDGGIDKQAADSLWRLGETYEHFLSDDIDVRQGSSSEPELIDFQLTWGDEERSQTVEAPPQVEFSLVPFDGLHPRQYEGIPFANDDETPVDDAIRADITVGLMPSSDPDNAGLTVTMNNRNVLFRDTENDLFSTRYLGKFRESAGHGRLYCVIELHGPPEDMPWSDTKDSLDGTEEITSHLLNITENALSEYRRQNYDSFPKWMLSPYAASKIEGYDQDVRDEIPEGVEHIDKSNSKVNSPRFNSKPGESERGKYYRAYPERDRLVKMVRLHSALGIRVDEVVPRKAQPAYEEFFYEEQDSDEQLVTLTASEAPDVDKYEIQDDDDDELVPLVEDIQKLAEEHVRNGELINENTNSVPAWLLPLYRNALSKHGERTDELDLLEEFDFEDWRKKNSISEEVRESEPPEIPGNHGEVGLSQKGDSSSTPDAGQRLGERSRESQGKSPQGQRQLGFDTSGTSMSDSVYEDTGDARSSISSTAESTKSRVPNYEVGLTSEQIESLSEYMDIPRESDSEALFDALIDVLEERQQLRDQLKQVGDVVDLGVILDDPPELNNSESE